MRKTLHALFILAAVALSARDPELAASGDLERFMAVVEKNFAAWDVDQDGQISTDEINQLVASADICGENAAAVAALKRASRTRKVSLPIFTLEHLKSLARTQPPAKDMPDFAAMFGGSLKRIQSANRELFTKDGPRVETIHQGRMGNCFSLAPLAALVHQRPDFVRTDMIRPQADGSIAVRLGETEVSVSPPTDAEIALCSGNEDGGLWVNVYEKAAGEAHNSKKPADKRDATGLDALNRGGSAGTQLAFITGREMFRVSCKFAKQKDLSQADHNKHMAELRAALASAVKEKRLMTCGTLKTSIPGITPNHAYAILGFDSAKDVIRLWNPHGDTTQIKGEPGPKNGYPMADGLFEMPLTVFVKEFAGTAYEVLPTPAKS